MMKVSIGLPVYNGERFLKAAIDAILAQTVVDFELIISDNASTDMTEKICRSYKDPRIRYYRSETNKGAAWNYNRVFQLATGKYFKWAAHDDVIAPDFLQRCVDALDDDPSAVLCQGQIKMIDEEGIVIKNHPLRPKLQSSKPHHRFSEMMLKHHISLHIFGLIRSDTLRKTKLIDFYGGSDRVLLAHLALLGRFIELPQYLFFSRLHAQQSSIKYEQSLSAYAAWFDPRNKGKRLFPWWRMMKEYLSLLFHNGLKVHESLICGCAVLLHMSGKSRQLAKEILRGGR